MRSDACGDIEMFEWPSKPIPIVVVGSTGVGKTAIAIELARKLNGEIINSDSMQVYRGMDIGTAKPSRVDKSNAMFHLLDIADPDKQINVSEWKALAETAARDIALRGKRIIICGGTGLYIKALLSHWTMAATPGDLELRNALKQRLEDVGSAALHAELAAVDPESAQRLHPNDGFRIVRAIEVYQLTGRSISSYWADDRAKETRRAAYQAGISMPRIEMYSRIELRVDEMLANGFVDEVRRLKSAGFSNEFGPMRSLGYKEIDAYLTGELSYDEAVGLIKQNTRRYAKRQQTWFRADPEIVWIDVQTFSSAEAAQVIIDKIP